MSKRPFIFFAALLCALFFFLLYLSKKESPTAFSGSIKIALREVGDQLLLANGDSSSRVLPVVEPTDWSYRLAFQEELSIMPEELRTSMEKQLDKHALPTAYRVEVLQCSDGEVAYSYERSAETEGEISCTGRRLPLACYTINLIFRDSPSLIGKLQPLFILLLGLAILLFLFYKRGAKASKTTKAGEAYATLGNFRFYPRENKLVKQAEEISLSQKECELLQLFISRPNELITRDELSKRVWEDKGVIVGRSLDTYISKLRKKLKGDERIKLINVHGVGYKLEC